MSDEHTLTLQLGQRVVFRDPACTLDGRERATAGSEHARMFHAVHEITSVQCDPLVGIGPMQVGPSEIMDAPPERGGERVFYPRRHIDDTPAAWLGGRCPKHLDSYCTECAHPAEPHIGLYPWAWPTQAPSQRSAYFPSPSAPFMQPGAVQPYMVSVCRHHMPAGVPIAVSTPPWQMCWVCHWLGKAPAMDYAELHETVHEFRPALVAVAGMGGRRGGGEVRWRLQTSPRHVGRFYLLCEVDGDGWSILEYRSGLSTGVTDMEEEAAMELAELLARLVPDDGKPIHHMPQEGIDAISAAAEAVRAKARAER